MEVMASNVSANKKYEFLTLIIVSLILIGSSESISRSYCRCD